MSSTGTPDFLATFSFHSSVRRLPKLDEIVDLGDACLHPPGEDVLKAKLDTVGVQKDASPSLRGGHIERTEAARRPFLPVHVLKQVGGDCESPSHGAVLVRRRLR